MRASEARDSEHWACAHVGAGMHKPHRTLNQHYTPSKKTIPRDRRTSAEGEKGLCVHEHHISANCAPMMAPGCSTGNRGHPGNQKGCGARACGCWDDGVGACRKRCACPAACMCTSWGARRRTSASMKRDFIPRIFPYREPGFQRCGSRAAVTVFCFFYFIFPCEKLLETLFFSRHLKAST